MRIVLRNAGLLLVTLALSLYSLALNAQEIPTPAPTPTMSMAGMGEMETDFSTDELAPLVQGIYEGKAVWFIHTEASDSDVADLLTDMMGPLVVAVPGLAEIPRDLLGNVYVFTNGVAGGGPMGFQPDVFDSVPGEANYTPLRALNLVTWREDNIPQQLNSVADIKVAEDDGAVEIEQPGVVINMPILAWPGGHR